MNTNTQQGSGNQVPQDELVALDCVRGRLAILWFGTAGAIILILVIQSLRQVYGTSVQEVWGWILPNLMPTLGLLVTVLGYTALDRKITETVVRRSFFVLAFWLSASYLFLILLTILVQPLTTADPVGLMRMSNLWLGPFQGLVASALGVLFVSKRRR